MEEVSQRSSEIHLLHEVALWCPTGWPSCDDPLDKSMIKYFSFFLKPITHNKADCHSGMTIPQYAMNPYINLINNIISLPKLYASFIINQSLHLCSGI
jgi:hypothetical protein